MKEDFQKGDKIKFTFNEQNGIFPFVTIHDPKNQQMIHYDAFSSATFHARANSDGRYSFTLSNQTNQLMDIEFSIVKLNEIGNADVGPINEAEIAAELKESLDGIIVMQKKHLARQVLHEKDLRSSKFLMVFLIGCEISFCTFMVFFVHKKTVEMFEKKRRI